MQTHQPRKRFSQNFLQDHQIIQQIIDEIAAKPGDQLVEIGPGLGALTLPLLMQNFNLTAIELDRDLAARLLTYQKQYPLFQLIVEDVLKVDFHALRKGEQLLRVVGNLPYAISTPLIFHLLQFSDDIEDMYFMLQKEVVERMVAAPGSKTYGRLSVMLQVAAEVSHCFEVSPKAFYPVPKVDSAIVCIRPYKVSPYPAYDKKVLNDLVTAAFSQRRKSIRNALKQKVDLKVFDALGIDSDLRPEMLSVETYVKLAATLLSSS